MRELTITRSQVAGEGGSKILGGIYSLCWGENISLVYSMKVRETISHTCCSFMTLFDTIKPIGCAFTVINILKMNYNQTCMTVYGVIQKSDIKKRERQYQELIICPWDS